MRLNGRNVTSHAWPATRLECVCLCFTTTLQRKEILNKGWSYSSMIGSRPTTITASLVMLISDIVAIQSTPNAARSPRINYSFLMFYELLLLSLLLTPNTLLLLLLLLLQLLLLLLLLLLLFLLLLLLLLLFLLWCCWCRCSCCCCCCCCSCCCAVVVVVVVVVVVDVDRDVVIAILPILFSFTHPFLPNIVK